MSFVSPQGCVVLGFRTECHIQVTLSRLSRVPGCGARGWRGCSGGSVGAPDAAGRVCPGSPGLSWLSPHAAIPRPQRPPTVPGTCTRTISVGVLGVGAPALPGEGFQSVFPGAMCVFLLE